MSDITLDHPIRLKTESPCHYEADNGTPWQADLQLGSESLNTENGQHPMKHAQPAKNLGNHCPKMFIILLALLCR